MEEKWHGTSGGYSNHKCRCDACRIAWNAYCAERKNARRAAYVYDENDEHGTDRIYQRGCTCDECKRGHADYKRNRLYMMSPNEYDALTLEQQGACAICGKHPRRLVVDHIHGTSRVRGLLCDGCNTGLGKLGDNEEGLLAALDYVRRNR